MTDEFADMPYEYQPDERQALLARQQGHEAMEQDYHTLGVDEQKLIDDANSMGYTQHPKADATEALYEHKEQFEAGQVVADQQAIDHYDHDHQGYYDQQPEDAKDSESSTDQVDDGF